VAVWVGFDKGRDLGLTGGEAALPTWARFVAATGLSGASFPVPGGLEKVKVCAQSLGLAGASCPLGLEDYSSHRPEPCAEHGGLLEQRAAQREAPAEGRPGVLERLRRRLGG
jgi:membrane carboxypeptidase/penicillin-binding protein